MYIGEMDDYYLTCPVHSFFPYTGRAPGERYADFGIRTRWIHLVSYPVSITVLIGKTTTHEFADGGPFFDLPAPPARRNAKSLSEV
jgi:hypothetical protein